MAFIQLDTNEWTNESQIKEIDYLPESGDYVVTLTSGEVTQYSSDVAKKALKKFLGQ
jgi:hypothetical protein